jgi:enoyl-CoA hydratase/carnithine racemase
MLDCVELQEVRVARSGPVTTVFLHRPGRRNAVDGPTVPAGQALAAAQELAAQLAAFPQACLRGDRASVLDQEGLDETTALAAEFAHGREALEREAGAGAARFAAGAGRHGTFS